MPIAEPEWITEPSVHGWVMHRNSMTCDVRWCTFEADDDGSPSSLPDFFGLADVSPQHKPEPGFCIGGSMLPVLVYVFQCWAWNIRHRASVAA